jgi:hypothetical protein
MASAADVIGSKAFMLWLQHAENYIVHFRRNLEFLPA